MGRIRVTLIDTDFLIDAGRGIAQAIECLDEIRANSALAISVVTQLKLMVGCRNKTELRKLDKFLKQVQVLRINEAISDKAVELLRQYRLSHGLLIADSLIAATALVMDVPLKSKNQSDFKAIAGLKLLPYP